MLAKNVAFDYEINGDSYRFDCDMFSRFMVMKIDGVELKLYNYNGGIFYDRNGFAHHLSFVINSGLLHILIDGMSAYSLTMKKRTVTDVFAMVFPLLFISLMQGFTVFCIAANITIFMTYNNKKHRTIMYLLSYAVCIIMSIIYMLVSYL